MIIQRNELLERLIQAKSHHLVKIITGIRNARLEFRQNEPTHLMENIIYNELRRRGFSVDVGVVESYPMRNGKQTRTSHEIDFVVNMASERIYIQSAFAIHDEDKRNQEIFSLRHIRDGFRKVVITGEPFEEPWRDDNGILYMGLKAFLLNPHSLETL